MGPLGKLFTPNVGALKRRRNTRGLLAIVEKDPFSGPGLEAIAALGELQAPEALDVLKRLFGKVYSPDVPFPLKDGLFQPIVAALAHIEGTGNADTYLNVFRSTSHEMREYALAIAMLGRLKDARAFDGMTWKLGSLGDNLHTAGYPEHVILLARALGHFGNTQAAPALIVSSYRMEQVAARMEDDFHRSLYLAVSTTLNSVLQESFGIGDESRRARVPSELYSLLVEHGVDKADSALFSWAQAEKVKAEYEVQDETEASIRALWETRETPHGRSLFDFRLRVYSDAADRRLEDWAATP